MSKLTPNLWFDNQAEEAARFYTSIFKNSAIDSISRYGKEGFEIHGQPEGRVMTVAFHLDDQPFVALNGGPQFTFSEAISFIIHCEDQAEVDHYWNSLSAGGDESAQACGWLKDKFGVSWQVVPKALYEMFADPDPAKVQRATKAMLQMKKLDIAALRKAFEG